MEIRGFGPDDVADLEAWASLENAVSAHDAPWEFPVDAMVGAGRFRHGWDGEPFQPCLARLDGEVVGMGAINTSEYDNHHLAWFQIRVHPGCRRQGVGSAILAALEAEAARRGRTVAGGAGWDLPATAAFAAHHGYEPKAVDVQRHQVLADLDHAALATRYDAALAQACDYDLERWSVPTPEDRLDELAVMASAINDAPTDDLDYEDEVFTGDRMRAYEVATAGKRERLYRLVARHRPSGELAAQTVVTVEIDHPERAHQEDTSVTRAHRGHRLGLLLKTAMLRWLAEDEPQLRIIETWNAESNRHMIEVNEALAYRVVGREIAYQRPLVRSAPPSSIDLPRPGSTRSGQEAAEAT